MADDWDPEIFRGNPFGEREPQRLGEVIEELKAQGLLVPEAEIIVESTGGGTTRITFTDDPLTAAMVDRPPDEFYPLGRRVQCDFCDTEWTDSDVSGGLLFESKAVCPDCVTGGFVERVEAEHEAHYIRGRCPAGQSFADWIRELRGPDAGTSIWRGQ